MANIHVADSFTPQQNQKFFFDNNIWMYLFCPIGNYKQDVQETFSNLLGRIKHANSKIYINSLVLAEFSHAYIMLEYNLWREALPETNTNTNYKKHFKLSIEYKETQKQIISAIYKIIRLANFCDDTMEKINFDNLKKNLKEIDFNDSYFIELCKYDSLIFVSNDNDFQAIPDDFQLIVKQIAR